MLPAVMSIGGAEAVRLDVDSVNTLQPYRGLKACQGHISKHCCINQLSACALVEDARCLLLRNSVSVLKSETRNNQPSACQGRVHIKQRRAICVGRISVRCSNDGFALAISV